MHQLNSLGCLNSAQFLGALNDNIFKLTVIFFLIQVEGGKQASDILAAVGALFVAPFLLFSSTAGFLADRFSKQKLLMWMKIAEIFLMLLAMIAFATQSIWGSYTILFILATHSALFGPSKYSIIPELVPPEKISKANGLVTSFTYIAIILGTFLASFLTEITHRNFVLIALFCLVIAIFGFLATLKILKTKPVHPEKKFTPLFIKEIFYTLKLTTHYPNLLIAVIGSSFFLFIGAYVQLNIIPYALQDLKLSDVAGGYLFLATALGIVIGSLIAGKASKNKIELGIPPLSGLGIALFLITLWLSTSSLILVILSLFGLGVCGGLFVVPFDAYIQATAPPEKRGQVIGAVNFLSFVGVLLASGTLYLFNVLQLTPAQGFALKGLFQLIITFIFIAKLSQFSLPFFAKYILGKVYKLEMKQEKLVGPLVLENATWLKIFLLLTIRPDLHFIFLKKKWLLSLFTIFKTYDDNQGIKEHDCLLECKEEAVPDTWKAISRISLFPQKNKRYRLQIKHFQ